MEPRQFLLMVLGIIIVGIMVAVGLSCHDIQTFDNGYKRGQIDALTGMVQFRLVTKADSSRTWEKIEPFKQQMEN